jgi:hypothetical protein
VLLSLSGSGDVCPSKSRVCKPAAFPDATCSRGPPSFTEICDNRGDRCGSYWWSLSEPRALSRLLRSSGGELNSVSLLDELSEDAEDDMKILKTVLYQAKRELGLYLPSHVFKEVSKEVQAQSSSQI